MSATVSMVERLRRMINEPDTTTYGHDDLSTIVERYPVIDSAGLSLDDSDWTPTYDLDAAAAEVWAEKAAAVAGDFDFTADGATYNRSQVYDAYMKLHRRFNARRKPGTIKVVRSTTDDDLTDTGT